MLKNIDIESQNPIAGGQFGDVYKVDLAGKAIAVKALRVFENSDFEKVLKVRFTIQHRYNQCPDNFIPGVFSRSLHMATMPPSECPTSIWSFPYWI